MGGQVNFPLASVVDTPPVSQSQRTTWKGGKWGEETMPVVAWCPLDCSSRCTCSSSAGSSAVCLGTSPSRAAFFPCPALPDGVSGEGWVTLLLLERAWEQGRASPPFLWGALLGEEVAGFCCWDLPPFLVQAQLKGPFQIVSVD